MGGAKSYYGGGGGFSRTIQAETVNPDLDLPPFLRG
jgi:hypothetical protein